MEEHSLENQGQVAIQVESTNFAVDLGNSVAIPLLLHSQMAFGLVLAPLLVMRRRGCGGQSSDK